MIIVDSREPDKYPRFLQKTFPGMEFKVQKLNEGDYASDKVLVERKTVPDLYTSIVGTRDKKGRFIAQLERMSVHDDELVILLITGSIGDYVSKMSSVGINVDADIIYGEISSATCRYGIVPMWIQDEWDALISMVKVMKKIDEGKYMVPSRRDPDILVSKLLGITLRQWLDIKHQYGSLVSVTMASKKDLMRIHGIGDAKAEKIHRVLKDRI